VDYVPSGGGCTTTYRQFFDPDVYRIVLFDQRGCGQSKPYAELEGNTTQNLVSDIELIREHLGIEQWVVFGGSWGSTLGLVYAETHPERVLGLILRGIFLCRPRDIQWFYEEGGAGRIYPDYWKEFIDPIPVEEQNNLLQAYYKRLTGDDEVTRMAAAKAWSVWEGRCATLQPSQRLIHYFSEPFTALSLARIESHYFMNDSFMQPNQILRDIEKLEDIPGIIVHGRYDTICPLEQAQVLHEAWPGSDLRIVPAAGHAATEPGITDALIRATMSMSEQLA